MNVKNKIHPYKFTLWIAIGSILMMFAGLTSAYIVKRNMANWSLVEMPSIFWVSTFSILISSITIYFAKKLFVQRKMLEYRLLFGLTASLGILFLILQIVGFFSYKSLDIKLIGAGSNASYSFLLAIALLHGLHVLGGVIALVVVFFKGLNNSSRNYSTVPIDVVSIYWHFVDLLWIYLFVFFSIMK